MEIAAAKMQFWQQQDDSIIQRLSNVGKLACSSDNGQNHFSNSNVSGVNALKAATINFNITGSMAHSSRVDVKTSRLNMNTLTTAFPSIAMPKVSANMRSENSDIAGCSYVNENPYRVSKSVTGIQTSAQAQASYCNPTTYSSENRPFYSGVQQSFSLSHVAEPYVLQRFNAQPQGVFSFGRTCYNSTWPYGADIWPPRHVIRPPPGFAQYLYPAYDKLFLPRPEFKRFNGNLLEFKSFLTNFETHVELRVQDSKMLFCLLLQHCENKVKPKIEYFGEKG